MKLQIIKQVSYKGDIKTYGKNKDKLLLYLFKNSNLKEIDIYSLSKTILKLRDVMEACTIGGQNENKNENENKK